MPNKKFQRCQEDFTCDNCGKEVIGNGYTNHCPYCLYSKHVDINPGDRAAECGGLMCPVGVEIKRGQYIVRHRCAKCGHEKPNRIDEADDMEVVIEIARHR
ncbi:MAG: RNHCP domain-containing protein [Patescibacteria group bacterium]